MSCSSRDWMATLADGTRASWAKSLQHCCPCRGQGLHQKLIPSSQIAIKTNLWRIKRLIQARTVPKVNLVLDSHPLPSHCQFQKTSVHVMAGKTLSIGQDAREGRILQNHYHDCNHSYFRVQTHGKWNMKSYLKLTYGMNWILRTNKQWTWKWNLKTEYNKSWPAIFTLRELIFNEIKDFKRMGDLKEWRISHLYLFS